MWLSACRAAGRHRSAEHFVLAAGFVKRKGSQEGDKNAVGPADIPYTQAIGIQLGCELEDSDGREAFQARSGSGADGDLRAGVVEVVVGRCVGEHQL